MERGFGVGPGTRLWGALSDLPKNPDCDAPSSRCFATLEFTPIRLARNTCFWAASFRQLMGWSAAETLECRVRGQEAFHETTRTRY